MKKSTLAVGVLVALGAVWTGGAWYTGKTAETELHRVVEIANEQLHQQLAGLDVDVQIRNLQINRGWFSSETKYDVVFSSPSSDDKMRLPFEGTVYHGPLPINQLRKANFKPVILSSEERFVKNDDTAPIFELTNGQNPFTNVMTVDYAQNIESESSLPYFKLGKETTRDGEILLQGARVKNSISHNKDIQASWHVDQFGMTGARSATDGLLNIHLRDINLTSDSKAIPEWNLLQTGKGELTIDEIQVQEQDEQSGLLIKGTQVDYSLDRKADFMDTQIGLSLKSATAKKPSQTIEIPLDYRIELAFKHADGALLNALLTKTGEQYAKNEELTEEEWNLLKQIAQKELNIQIKQNLNNPQGNSDGLIDFTFANVNFEQEVMKGDFYALFKAFNIQANLNKAGLIDFLVARHQVQGKDKSAALDSAKAEIEEMFNRAISENILAASEQGAKLNLVLDKQADKLMLNGQELPKESVMMALFMLMMGMNGGH